MYGGDKARERIENFRQWSRDAYDSMDANSQYIMNQILGYSLHKKCAFCIAAYNQIEDKSKASIDVAFALKSHLKNLELKSAQQKE
ncbi:MAG: hypothetical protein P4L22_06875 [Candidatus Babeliales bacterium]|nr:hypothetical protein [Candidatus Babeliales bacterium]